MDIKAVATSHKTEVAASALLVGAALFRYLAKEKFDNLSKALAGVGIPLALHGAYRWWSWDQAGWLMELITSSRAEGSNRVTLDLDDHEKGVSAAQALQKQKLIRFWNETETTGMEQTPRLEVILHPQSDEQQ